MHPKISEGWQILNVFSFFFFPDQEMHKQLEIRDYSFRIEGVLNTEQYQNYI